MTKKTSSFQASKICSILLAGSLMAVSVQIFAEPAKDKSTPIDIAAELIGVDVDTMWEAVKNGQTIADIATANGMDSQTIIDAFLAKKQAGIDAAVDSGKATAEEAAEWLARAEIGVAEYVNEPMKFERKDKKDDKGNFLSVSLADVTIANGMDPRVLIDAVLAEIQKGIDAKVASGKITAEKAVGWLARMEIKVAEYVKNPIELDSDGKDKKDRKAQYDFPPIVFELLGIDKSALWEAVKNGQTIADIATTNGRVEPQTIVDALLAETQTDIDAKVASGGITAEEAAEWLAKVEIRVNKFVNKPIFRSYPKGKKRNDKPSMDKASSK
ncbi:hypothetical protein QUF74_04795 [Candidatus Halobeggiatoa sp. HSG11]|nr:hypothetical protein [Candidatus Halobeggiatoa sp. HSG11]